MSSLLDVKDLFAPLGERLTEFESGQYLFISKTILNEFGDKCYFNYGRIIDPIGRKASLYESSLIWEEAEMYHTRVTNIIANLQPIKAEIFESSEITCPIKKPSTERTRNFWMKFYKEELSYYLKGLDAIKNFSGKTRKYASAEKENIESIQAIKNEFPLPEKFSVIQSVGFEQKLSPEQTALFLHYLMRQEIIPPYNAISLEQMAKFFFGSHDQRVRRTPGNFHNLTKNKKHLRVLQEMLQKLLNQINDDLKSAS